MLRKLVLGKMMVVLACVLNTPSAKAQLTALEQQALAQRFRPYFKTSLEDNQAEPVHPCNWQWFVGHCNLRINDEIVVLTAQQLAANPARLIEPSGADIRTSPLTSPGYILTLSNDTYLSGEPWNLVIHEGHGIYAHVEEIDQTLVNIEYSVLWPYNQTTVFFGKHHGDLTTMTVIYDRGCDKLVRVTYVTHGEVIQTFRITHPSRIQFVVLKGLDMNGNQTTVEAAQLGIAGVDQRQEGPSWHSPCNLPTVYLAKDPVSSRFEHPVIYVEWGAHEFWPAPCGSAFSAPKHDGDGLSFLPDVVQMLGTLDSPESVHVPFIYYNGKLGDDPQPLLLHRTFFWPEGRDHNRYGIPEDRFSDRSPYEQHDQVAWPPTHDCAGGNLFVYVDRKNTGLINGSSQYPFRTVAQALAFVPLGGSIVIAPGSYPENLVISRPSKLISSGDTVIIGTPR
jgi:hypothetical protein